MPGLPLLTKPIAVSISPGSPRAAATYFVTQKESKSCLSPLLTPSFLIQIHWSRLQTRFSVRPGQTLSTLLYTCNRPLRGTLPRKNNKSQSQILFWHTIQHGSVGTYPEFGGRKLRREIPVVSFNAEGDLSRRCAHTIGANHGAGKRNYSSALIVSEPAPYLQKHKSHTSPGVQPTG